MPTATMTEPYHITLVPGVPLDLDEYRRLNGLIAELRQQWAFHCSCGLKWTVSASEDDHRAPIAHCPSCHATVKGGL